jgi:hypothetical protein
MHNNAVTEVQKEQELIHEIEIQNKIEKEIKENLEKTLHATNDEDAKERLKSVIEKVSTMNLEK